MRLEKVLTLWSRCGDKFVGETARTLDKCIQVGMCTCVRKSKYRVSLLKGTFVIFCLISVLEVGFYFFHMCFGIRISSPFHLAIQKVSIQNLNCPKNAKNACADMISIPAQSLLCKAGIKIMPAHGQLRF